MPRCWYANWCSTVADLKGIPGDCCVLAVAAAEYPTFVSVNPVCGATVPCCGQTQTLTIHCCSDQHVVLTISSLDKLRILENIVSEKQQTNQESDNEHKVCRQS